jgi:cell division septation protein DedD
MTAKRIAGTLVSVALAGVDYPVAADANITETDSEYENDAIATSGANMRKMTRRATMKESVTLILDSDERAVVKAHADTREDISLKRTNSAGDVERADGWIEMEPGESEENRVNIKMFSRTNKWSVTIGEV